MAEFHCQLTNCYQFINPGGMNGLDDRWMSRGIEPRIPECDGPLVLCLTAPYGMTFAAGRKEWCVAVGRVVSEVAGLALLCMFAREARVLVLATVHTGTGRLSQLHEHTWSK